MDHSMQAYIMRMPTEQITTFIQQYLNGEHTENFDAMIPLLQAELERRKAQ